MKIGKDSVVFGNVPPDTEVGDGSVYIGATDSRGNTIINQSMAVGRGAYAGPGSIAIGAFAGAGSELGSVLSELSKIIETSSDQSLKISFHSLCLELNKPQRDKNMISKLWEIIKVSATLNGAISLVGKASTVIAELIK